jgi:RNA polymerase sigma-70 factor (ECF subfamily)
LDGLHDESDRQVWAEFDRRYRPILLGFARQLGLDDNDAADVAQESLVRFLSAYRSGEYDRGRGRLRSWLVAIAKYRVADHRRATAQRRVTRGQSAIVDVPEDNELEQIWEAEQRQVIFDRAMDELRQTTRLTDETLEAFDRLVVHSQPVQQVATALDMTPQGIYDAKSRVVAKLRDILHKYRTLYQED